MGTLTTSLSQDGSIRIIFSQSTSIVTEAQRIHRLSKTATAALGRALTATSIMPSTLKNVTDSLTLQIKGDGPLGTFLCVGVADGCVRGYVARPETELPLNAKGKFDVGGAVGAGQLYVIKDMGLNKPYVGVSNLISGEIAEDIAEYYAVSEQIPTVCALGVRVAETGECIGAGGFLLQLMPFADKGLIPKIEENISSLESISLMIAKGESVESILKKIYKDIAFDILDSCEAKYRCNCSKDKYAAALITLGEKELREMTEDNEPIEARCNFCDTKYIFSTEEMKELLEYAVRKNE